MASDDMRSPEPPSRHDDLEAKTADALERIGHALRGLLRSEAARHGLSPIQAQILLHLHETGERDNRLGRLAEYFDLAKGTLSEAIGTLESKGLVVRRLSSTDGRTRPIRLTAKGRRVAQRLSPWAAPIRESLRGLARSDRVLLYRRLLDIIAALQQAGVITVARMCITCRFFEHRRGEEASSYYCRLLEQPLAEPSLRIDCPDHEVA